MFLSIFTVSNVFIQLHFPLSVLSLSQIRYTIYKYIKTTALKKLSSVS